MTSRGLRDNNPGNLRHNPLIKWRNELPPDDEGYCRFPSSADGLHAMAMDLHTKWARGLDTIAKIIPVYAPPSENPTRNYEANIALWTGWKVDQRLDFSNASNLAQMLRAMVREENGSMPFVVGELLAAARSVPGVVG